jgi:hypothetical protein
MLPPAAYYVGISVEDLILLSQKQHMLRRNDVKLIGLNKIYVVSISNIKKVFSSQDNSSAVLQRVQDGGG